MRFRVLPHPKLLLFIFPLTFCLFGRALSGNRLKGKNFCRFNRKYGFHIEPYLYRRLNTHANLNCRGISLAHTPMLEKDEEKHISSLVSLYCERPQAIQAACPVEKMVADQFTSKYKTNGSPPPSHSARRQRTCALDRRTLLPFHFRCINNIVWTDSWMLSKWLQKTNTIRRAVSISNDPSHKPI